jgi:acyl dehydratase
MSPTWTIGQLVDEPARHAGVVVLEGRASNQHGEVVAEAEARLLVGRRPA